MSCAVQMDIIATLYLVLALSPLTIQSKPTYQALCMDGAQSEYLIITTISFVSFREILC